MKQFSLIIFLILIAVANAWALEPPDQLKVGAILPLSGDAATLGKSVHNGMKLALTKLAPEVRSRIELIIEDDGLQAKNTVFAFSKLVNQQAAEVILNVSSGTANAISPLAEQHRVPLVALGASDPRVVQGRAYVMNFFVSPDQQAKTIVPYMVGRGYKKIARITSIQDGLLAQKTAFDPEKPAQIEIVLDEDYSVGEKDFKTYIAKIRSRNDVDAVLAYLLTGQIGVFAKQLRRAGFDKPLIGSETYEDSNEVGVSEGALIGARYVNAADPSSSFVEEYAKAFPGESLVLAPYGYDIILLLGKAVEQTTHSEGVNKFLHSVKDFTGALGTYSSTNDNRFTLPAVMKEVTADGFREIDNQ